MSKTILVIRPALQAKSLCNAITTAKFQAYSFPCIDIAEVSNQAKLKAQLPSLNDTEMVIFISPNAVQYGLPIIKTHLNSHFETWQQHIEAAAIGSSTARCLIDFNFKDVFTPKHGANSAALLEHPALQTVSNKNIVIVRGEGGNNALATSLKERGANVSYLEVYKRLPPQSDPKYLIETIRTNKIHAIMATSQQALHNLYQLFNGNNRALLLATDLIISSQNMLNYAKQLGFSGQMIVAEDATDASLVSALDSHSLE